MKLRKSLSAVLSSVLLAGTLVGCGGAKDSSGSTGNSQGGNGDSEKIEIVFSHGKDATGVPAQLIEAFQKKNPNITVKELEQPAKTDAQHDDYVTKLSTGDASIDVFAVDIIWPPEFGAADWTLPLNDYFTQEELDKFLPGPVEGNTYNGKLYSIPFYTDAGVLFYRKDILEKAGVQPPKTFEELVKLSKELKGQEGTEYGFVFQGNQYEGLVCGALEYMWGNGGDVLNDKGEVVIDSKNNVEALQYMTDLVKSDFVPKGVTTYVEEDARTLFTEGKVVFMRNWPYAWGKSQEEGSKVKDKVGIVPMPVGPSGTAPAAALGGWNLAVNKNVSDENKEAAVKFIKFVTSPEGQKILAMGGRQPILKETYKDQEVLAKNPHLELLYGAFVNAKPRPVSPIYPQISDVMQIQIHKTITGEIKAEEAVKNMQEELSKLVKP
ncbi:ABC transporter substrate-binding protein [Ammoniphilus sp. 3BR4]|uniref:ABC transporter substrate-binding protein n=1 Tax=Ammoniphilus sp. 3BR4 TaxID=3158265 RepID=UPI0034668FBA